MSHGIDELDLSTRALRCLMSTDIRTIEQLAEVPDDDLLRIRNFGPKSLREVRDKIHAYDVARHGYFHWIGGWYEQEG